MGKIKSNNDQQMQQYKGNAYIPVGKRILTLELALDEDSFHVDSFKSLMMAPKSFKNQFYYLLVA